MSECVSNGHQTVQCLAVADVRVEDKAAPRAALALVPAPRRLPVAGVGPGLTVASCPTSGVVVD